MFFRDLQDLTEYLKVFSRTPRILVVLGADRELFREPEWKRGLAGFLDEIALILVLSDHTSESVAEGHRMRPRYLSFMDEDADDLLMVLDGIIDSSAARAGEHAAD